MAAIFNPLLIAVFALAMIALALCTLDKLFPRGEDTTSQQFETENEEEAHSLLEILRQRLARGEISKEKFDRMKHDLEG